MKWLRKLFGLPVHQWEKYGMEYGYWESSKDIELYRCSFPGCCEERKKRMQPELLNHDHFLG